MQKFIEFWNTNSALITQIGVIAAGTILTFIFDKFLKRTGTNVLNYSTQVVSKMFGGDVELKDVNRHIKELKFVQDLNSYVTTINETNELKLIDVKRKIKSPHLSSVERLVFENEYKVLSKLLANKLSPETEEILRKIDELTTSI